MLILRCLLAYTRGFLMFFYMHLRMSSDDQDQSPVRDLVCMLRTNYSTCLTMNYCVFRNSHLLYRMISRVIAYITARRKLRREITHIRSQKMSAIFEILRLRFCAYLFGHQYVDFCMLCVIYFCEFLYVILCLHVFYYFCLFQKFCTVASRRIFIAVGKYKLIIFKFILKIICIISCAFHVQF